MFDDINFLVQETFNDLEKPKAGSGFFAKLFAKDEKLPEEVPGLIYHLQKKSSTFVLRIHPTANLKKEYKNIIKHPDMFPALRLNEGDEPIETKLQFFECDRFEIAQNIRAQLGNKRFSIFEERVLNISDPGDSWWLKIEENKIILLFKLSYTDDISNLVKLGPLGEVHRSADVLIQLRGYFKMIFPIAEYSCSHGHWTLSCAETNNGNFENLKKLFIEGETSHEFWEYLRYLEVKAENKPFLESVQKANYFLLETSLMRRFWKEVENQL
ncbi:MAG: hypothetical protein HON90_13270 [Halobacteriovoraceae bacterium]|nr:hypothetical protein [Halobacteriovoraceae bacterium]